MLVAWSVRNQEGDRMEWYTIRAARVEDAAAIAWINVASWRQTYQGIMPDEALAVLDVDELATLRRQRLMDRERGVGGPLACGFVAVDGADRVLGYAFGGEAQPMANGRAPEPFESEVYAIYLAPGYERCGLGARLLAAAVTHLRANGARSTIIWALERNPNRGFYEALGGVVAYEQLVTIGGQTLPEVGFGWEDLDALIARLSR